MAFTAAAFKAAALRVLSRGVTPGVWVTATAASTPDTARKSCHQLTMLQASSTRWYPYPRVHATNKQTNIQTSKVWQPHTTTTACKPLRRGNALAAQRNAGLGFEGCKGLGLLSTITSCFGTPVLSSDAAIST
jgi:hypothetical protein